MSTTRRRFVTLGAGLGAAAFLGVLRPRLLAQAAQDAPSGGRAAAPAASPAGGKADTPLHLLILGGTGFLGPHVIDAALARGHTMTLFNRGRTNPGLYPDLEKLEGDRDPDKGAGLSALKDRTFDAVVDTSGYVPRIVKASTELLAPHSKQYLFVSTISVFAETSAPGMTEDAPLATIDDETNEDVMANYGALKALCERAAEAAMPGRTTVVRPGLIVGPGDPTDRYTYWPARLARGGEVLAPGDGTDPVQYVDVRDLAAFMVHLLEAKATGVYNATGPAQELAWRPFLDACKAGCAAAGTGELPNRAADATFTWVPAEFLEQHEVAAWQDLPMWVPGSGDSAGFSRVDCSKAIAAGLAFRPAADTARDTLAWHATRPAERRDTLRGGLTAEREAQVLAAWRQAQG